MFAANIEEQTQRNWEVQVDSKNVSLKGGAEANGCFNISESLDEAAAWLDRWLAKGQVEEAVEHIGADTELEGVFRALTRWISFRSWLWLWLWLRGGATSTARIAATAGGYCCEKEEIESQEKGYGACGSCSHLFV